MTTETRHIPTNLRLIFGKTMNDNQKSIQRQVEVLKNKILTVWNNEGKWDLENPDAQYNGLENDPIVNLLLTAVVYQTNLIKEELNAFNSSLVDDCYDYLLPYNLVSPVPAIAMMEAYPNKGRKSIVLDDLSRFVVKKKNSKSKAPLSFYPIVKTKIINAKIEDIKRISDNTWDIELYLEEPDDNLAGVSFYFDEMKFSDIKVYHNHEEIPIIKPWEIDRLPLNAMFSANNHIYNSSMVYGVETQLFDLLAENDMNLFMVPAYYDKPLGENHLHLTFEFVGCTSDIDLYNDNFHINCFPIVNVVLNNNNNSMPFVLTESKPIVCISNENTNDAPSYFMNLALLDDNDYRDKDKFILRRFGAERFNLNELLILGKKLTHKYQSDFYAFQSIEQFQNSSVIQKFDDLLKEILEILSKQDNPSFGIYAILKHTRSNSSLNNAIKINALFTNGSFANCNDRDVTIMPPSFLTNVLDAKSTRLLTKITGGKNPVIDNDVKQQMAKYYILTNDRIVTRNDLKSFVKQQLVMRGIKSECIHDISISNQLIDDSFIQNVEIVFDNSIKNNEFTIMLRIIEKLANLRCTNGCDIRISIKNA